MSGQSSATKWTNPRRRAFLAVALVLLMGLGFAGFRLSRRLAPLPPDASSSTDAADPRRSYDGPYRNIHPDVRYVGDAQCADCHQDIARSYARHPMGRSLVAVEDLLDRQRYTPDTNNPFDILGRRFEVDRQGKRLWHRQALLDDSGKPVVELSLQVHWVIGSGAKGYSYLTERDGYLFQTPISWFAHQQRWDLSPGFGPSVLSGRPVLASCLFCHANHVQEHPEQPDRFVPPVGGLVGGTGVSPVGGLVGGTGVSPVGGLVGGTGVSPVALHAIGCERCHGPGELHVHTADRWDIVDPARLTPEHRDAVCEQCHLEGEARVLRAGRKLFDYRPGLPLHDFWAVLVQGLQSGEDAKAVNHVEQMYQSKCFSHPVDSVKLGCITCHNPHIHIGPTERQTHYRAKCLQCHDETKKQTPCSESASKRKPDNCIACHMPRYRSSDIAHTASTDHRIVRRPMHQPVPPTNPPTGETPVPPTRPPTRPPTSPPTGGTPVPPTDLESAVFVDFYRDRFPGGDPQTERTLGLGLVKMMNANMLQPQRHADRALRFLESALASDPTDSSLREGKVEAYLLLHRPAEALSEAELLLPKQRENWQLLVQAAYAAQAEGQMDRAGDYWRRTVEINPYVADYQDRLMGLLIRAGKLDEARKHCEQILRLDPFNVSGRQAWVGFLLQKGQRDEAQRAFDIIRRVKPPDLREREQWFRQQMR